MDGGRSRRDRRSRRDQSSRLNGRGGLTHRRRDCMMQKVSERTQILMPALDSTKFGIITALTLASLRVLKDVTCRGTYCNTNRV